MQTDPTLLRYASAITEHKKCWGLLVEKFDRFQTWRNNTQQHPTTCNSVCKRTQHVTSNNVGSCWPTMLRPFARGFRFSFVFTYQLCSNRVKLIFFACAVNTSPRQSHCKAAFDQYLNFNNFLTMIIICLFICFLTASQPASTTAHYNKLSTAGFSSFKILLLLYFSMYSIQYILAKTIRFFS